MAAKPATPSRVSAASVPPVIITSASPYWIVRKALPMEFAALAQAVTMHSLGPRSPHWIETWPLAELAMSLGMVKAETLSGPLVSSRSCWVSSSAQAADAGTDHHAAAERIVLGEVDAASPSRRRRRPRWQTA